MARLSLKFMIQSKYSSNPTPNVIINRPGGPNVYKGVPIDYSGDVSAC